MFLHRYYNLIVNDIIIETSSNKNKIVDEWLKIRKRYPKAYIQACFG